MSKPKMVKEKIAEGVAEGVAVFERDVVTREYVRGERPAMRCPRDASVYAHGQGMHLLDVEEFRVLVLDGQNRLSYDVLVSRGILNSSLVHPREVFREAIKRAAASIILLHNHPSGDPAASADDRAITSQLMAAGRLLDIPINDHIIVAGERYLSFSEAGLL